MTKTFSNRCMILLAVVVLVQLFLATPGARGEVVDRIVAEVNDEIITMSELDALSRSVEGGVNPKGKEVKTIQRQLLDTLIDRKLAKAEAKKRGISIADKDINQAVEDFKKRTNLPNEAALTQALTQAGLTMNELRQQIADQIQQERLMAIISSTAKIAVSDAEIRRYYEEYAKEGGNHVHLRVVRLPFPPGASQAQKDEVKQKTETILKEIRQGGSFSEAAKKNGASETDMGFISQNDLAPQLVEYLNRLKPKDVAPIETPDGFQLVELVARRAGQPPSFEEAAPQIRKLLMRREMEKQFTDWLKTLREKAHIKIML
jgi:peptidyl-prolyl cis-trans isomerase SurA